MLGGQFDWGGLLLKGNRIVDWRLWIADRQAFVAPRRGDAASASGCMLGNPGIRRYEASYQLSAISCQLDDSLRDNPIGADNQQETMLETRG